MIYDIKKLRTTLVGLSFFLFSLFLKAHSPSEISYIFSQKKENIQLKIILTPQSAFDLIDKLRPNQNNDVINFNDYQQEFEDYFNQHIKLNFNHKNRHLILDSIHIKEHESYLIFDIPDTAHNVYDYMIQITAFLKIYPHTVNYVEMPFRGDINKCFLDNINTICSSSNQLSSSESTISHFHIHWWEILLGVLGISLISYMAYKYWIKK